MEIVFGLKGENAEPLLLQKKKKKKSFCNLSDVYFVILHLRWFNAMILNIQEPIHIWHIY